MANKCLGGGDGLLWANRALDLDEHLRGLGGLVRLQQPRAPPHRASASVTEIRQRDRDSSANDRQEKDSTVGAVETRRKAETERGVFWTHSSPENVRPAAPCAPPQDSKVSTLRSHTKQNGGVCGTLTMRGVPRAREHTRMVVSATAQSSVVPSPLCHGRRQHLSGKMERQRECKAGRARWASVGHVLDTCWAGAGRTGSESDGRPRRTVRSRSAAGRPAAGPAAAAAGPAGRAARQAPGTSRRRRRRRSSAAPTRTTRPTRTTIVVVSGRTPACGTTREGTQKS